MVRTILIDGDVVLYQVAEAVADSFDIDTFEDDDYIYRSIGWANKQTAIDCLEATIDKIQRDCKGQEVAFCLSDPNGNFRKKINPNYKGNRKGIKPILYKFLRDYMTGSGYTIWERPNLEADDVIGILATSEKIIKGDKVVWSLDKDFKTIPCKFHKCCITKADESRVISKEEADWWFMYQTLIGDRVDGYSGCPNIGDKKARKILGEVGEKSLEEMWELVVNTFEKEGLSKEEALLNARMARILRAEDYDFKKKEVKLWEFI